LTQKKKYAIIYNVENKMPLEDLERIPQNYSVEIVNGGGYWIVSIYKRGMKNFIVRCLSRSLQEALHLTISLLEEKNG
jgi:hypothetical protein